MPFLLDEEDLQPSVTKLLLLESLSYSLCGIELLVYEVLSN
jgi:hypothetical protein